MCGRLAQERSRHGTRIFECEASHERIRETSIRNTRATRPAPAAAGNIADFSRGLDLFHREASVRAGPVFIHSVESGSDAPTRIASQRSFKECKSLPFIRIPTKARPKIDRFAAKIR